MIEVRKFDTLGHFEADGLEARHHFCCPNLYDAKRAGWGALRVWNDDCLAARSSVSSRLHRDMEIITYVRRGAITHRDSMGSTGRISAGDVQVISTGKGVTHSEVNLENEEARLFQIWIRPDHDGGSPGWGVRRFQGGFLPGQFVALASGMVGDEALPIRANARVAAARMSAGSRLSYPLDTGRHVYLVAESGRVRVNGEDAERGDGIAIRDEAAVHIEARDDAMLLLVDSA